jgi:hypothetical protein
MVIICTICFVVHYLIIQIAMRFKWILLTLKRNFTKRLFQSLFAKLRKATVAFVMSIRIELSSYQKDFHEI